MIICEKIYVFINPMKHFLCYQPEKTGQNANKVLYIL